MTSPPDKSLPTLHAEALDWVIRLREAGASDWEAFERWMAADPRAAEIYWNKAEADADGADALALPLPAADVVPLRRPARAGLAGRKWLAGAGVALAASILLVVSFLPGDGDYSVATRSGETRVVALESGSEVLLNGDTTLALDKRDPRTVRFGRGEAKFTVRHDPAHVFRVHVGDAVLVDLGTVFSVASDDAGLRVAVAEGAVRYRRGDVSRDLRAGDTLRIGRDGRPVAGRIDPADVAAWAEGRLSYDGAAVSAVAADLSRSTGLAIAVDPAVAARPFSGGFALGDRDVKTVRRAAGLMGLELRARGDGWIIGEPGPGQP